MYLLSQPSQRLKDALLASLSSRTYSTFTFSVAYAKMSGIEILRDAIIQFKENGGIVTGIIGVDQKNTSIEALRELIDLCNSSYVFHSENIAQTFHPKCYFFDRPESVSHLLLGSGNLTNGGLLNNFELNAGAQLNYNNEPERTIIDSIKGILDSYLNNRDLCKPLDLDFLQALIEGNYIVTEESQRVQLRQSASGGNSRGTRLFGSSESMIFGTRWSVPAAQEETVSEIVVSDTEEVLAEIEEEDNEINAGFWKKLRKNDVSRTSSPGQIQIPKGFKDFFPTFINQQITPSGASQEETHLRIKFIRPTGEEVLVNQARAIFYTPAPNHPRQNPELRFTFLNHDISDNLAIDDLLVFNKTTEAGIDFQVRHITPNMDEYQMYNGRYDELG